ncbi:hypothetical protein [Sinomicrobium pectinilyticum]|uniref:hypothetical protein n=1 Tax=Sinomicrobium pectinilyticum TaxID=1084421 RepID=UPI001474FD97|nr:hypothetical protein [Sinomicrobium pectinilyticum]
MKASQQKLQHLQQQWSAEMATFHELQQTHKALNEELLECWQKLETLTSPVRFRRQNV